MKSPILRGAMGIPVVAALLGTTGLALAAAEPLVNRARVTELAGFLPPQPAGFGWPIDNRAAWERLARLPDAPKAVRDAEDVARQPIPDLPDELFLEFSKTGDRDRWQSVAFARRRRVATLTLGECLENRGRFLQPLEAVVNELCRERTWVYPAHDRSLANFRGTAREMDLGAVFVAMELAEADYLLGRRLSPDTRRVLREHVRRRVLHPFREMAEGKLKEIGWMRTVNNWNAVCLGSIAAAALALEEAPEDRAFYVAAAERYVRFFLSGFTPDGYCSEGVGYWNYGFGHYILLAEAVRRATQGRLDLMADPTATQPALFCVRSEIVNGLFPTIADCTPGSRPDARMVAYVGRRFGLEQAVAQGKSLMGPGGGLAVTMMTYSCEEPLPIARGLEGELVSPWRTWFGEGGVLICRPSPGASAPFAAVLKGGHNAEQHNHNDVGSFSVVLGDKMVVCDPGGEVYTARTFSAQRYESKVLSSFGHAVPVVDGQLQQTGPQAKGVVLNKAFSETEDVLQLDLRSAYAVKNLRTLERTFRFQRGAHPALTVTDEVVLESPGRFETALVTWGEAKQLNADTLQITDGDQSLLVKVETGGVPFALTQQTLDEDVHTPRQPLRLGLTLQPPITNATVRLTFRPANSR